jgi:hypothetical protein
MIEACMDDWRKRKQKESEGEEECKYCKNPPDPNKTNFD